MANENDIRVRTLRTQIEEKRNLLKSRSSRFVPITNASLDLFGTRYNLHTLDRGMTILVGSQLQALEVGVEALDLKPTELVINGYPITDWITDIKARLESILVKEEETKLRALDAKLRELLSEDAKTDDALKEIEGLLT